MDMEPKMETAPRPERLERSVDHEIAEILAKAQLAGFGANAFVFRVPGYQIPGRIVDELRELGERSEAPPDVAMKMLKVYEAGTAEREVRMQQRAWEILREQAENPDYAAVPRVYFSHTAHFTPVERQQLAELGFSIGASADIILMDFIQGRDLKEILAEEVMKRSEGAQPRDIQRTAEPESDFRYGFLKKRGYTIHPAIAERLERTIKLLHARGVYHNDLHEANVMVDGDLSSPDCRVTIIDFGAADGMQQREYGEKPIDDLMVVRRILAHQKEQQGRVSEEESAWLSDIERLRERARSHQLYERSGPHSWQITRKRYHHSESEMSGRFRRRPCRYWVRWTSI